MTAAKNKGGFKNFWKKIDGRLTTENLVKILREDLKLYFGGSRRFKEKAFIFDCHPPEDYTNVDDWDFSYDFSSTKVEPRLLDLGFVRQEIGLHNADMYSDVSFASLWKHPDHKIDVVGRNHFHTYRKLFDSIPADFYYNYLWKSAPHRPQDAESVRDHKVFIKDFINFNLTTNF